MSRPFDDINSPSELKQLNLSELQAFSDWLRNFLIEKIAENGGHFAANIGVVELTVALHYIYEAPKDIFVWDVGHQAYAHKILTGRKIAFDSLRKKGGISGFPKMSESQFDDFGTGHSSTSISAVLGYAVAARLSGIERQHLAIIGDGALSAGQAFEAINNAGVSNTNITIIINDNHIGIDPSQGALGEYLEQLEFKNENLFTDFGFQYFGPIDGHDIIEMTTILQKVKELDGPKIVHVRTIKGKGYAPAEAEQTKWHSTSKFDKISGKGIIESDDKVKYQDVFGRTLLELAEKDPKIVAVTPAMISGSSLHFMQDKFPERVFDVGIAEQHALTFSAGLAASGMKPFCCIYSTFLQRAYDQLIHDIALQNLPVIFAVDRAGIVGEDGPTHHGVFDIAFLQTIPNITIACPSNQKELRDVMYTALQNQEGPFVIRYPRGKSDNAFMADDFETIKIGKGICIRESNSDAAILSLGTIIQNCLDATEGMNISVYDMRFAKPIDLNFMKELFNKYSKILVIEEAQTTGGYGSTVLQIASENDYQGKIKTMGINDHFVGQGSIKELMMDEGIDSASIRAFINTF